MADVLDFNSAKNKKKQNQSNKNPKRKSASVQRIITNQDVFREVNERVLDQWEKYAALNKLNAFIHSKIPAFARGAANADYLNDLNVISDVEQKLGMRVIMLYPDVVMSDNQHNWLVGFKRGIDVYSTSVTGSSEAHARTLNVLLYLGLEFKLKKMNRL